MYGRLASANYDLGTVTVRSLVHVFSLMSHGLYQTEYGMHFSSLKVALPAPLKFILSVFKLLSLLFLQ